MAFCVICSLHRFQCPSQRVNVEQHHLWIPEYTRELENLQIFSLNSLAALLAILAMSGSKRLQVVVSALLIYTISLRPAIHTCFLRDRPTLSLYLHVVPLLTIPFMAGVELVLDISPAVAVVVLVLSILPLTIIILRHGRDCGDNDTALPIRVRDSSAVVSSSANATVVLEQL